jgi:hypothetical protein
MEMAASQLDSLQHVDSEALEGTICRMKKLTIIAGVVLVLIGLAALSPQGWKFGKQLPSFDKQWPFASGELQDLRIESDYPVELKFVKTGDGTNAVSINGQAPAKTIQQLLYTELDSGTLNLDLRENPRKFWDFFDFNFRRTPEIIVVSLADGSVLDKLGMNLSSGSLTMTDVQVKSADLTVDSGSAEINNLTADQWNIHASSGSVRGNGIHAESTVTADSGSVRLEHVTGKMHVTADSGSVKLYKDDTTDTDIKADSGSVYVHLPSSFSGFFDLQADSGSIRAPQSKRDTKDLLKVRASSGSIVVEQG